MARGKRHRRVHQQRQVPRPAHAQSPHDAEMDAMQQELVVELRRGLRSDTPLDLLAWVSGIVQSVEGEVLAVSPGDADLGGIPGFGPDGDVPDVPVTLRLLVESFEHTPFAETTAALLLIRAFTRDDEVRAAAGVALSPRRHPLPAWLARLDEVRATDVLHLTHVLGDGDDYLWGVRFADGSEVTVLVYVDHNLGGAVKDAFVIPDSVRSVSAYMVDHLEPGQHLAPTDAATARAAVTEALRVGDLFVEPLESETWPMQRPLVEWALRLLPDGGRAPEEREVAEGEMAAILDDFLAAPEGRALQTADERGLVELALSFASYHAGGADPLRWSPVSVEMLLLDFVPRKVMADSTYLLGLPDVLSPLVRYAHRVRGVPAPLTNETLDALAELTPAFVDAVTGDRTPSTAAQVLLDTLGLDSVEELAQFDPDTLQDMLDIATGESFSPGAFMRGALVRAVGSEEALEVLDDAPLPDEPFDWSGVPEDVHDVVAQWLDLSDRCADAMFDVEHRTVFRRFLARVAIADPAVFRGRGSPVRGAAALVWSAARANHTVGFGGSVVVKDLMAWFGLTGSVSQRAEPLLRAIGAGREVGPWTNLGDPRLLVARRRAEIIEDRGRW